MSHRTSRIWVLGNSAARGRRGEQGFSLLEGLFAAALLLVVAVSVLPLFMRALESNTRGGRASQASTLVTAELEEINQASIDRADWQLVGATQNVRSLNRLYWDTGDLASDSSPAKLGDEVWVDSRGAASGPILWARDFEIRKYSFADIHITINVDGTTLESLGDPRLFDSPLTTDGSGELNNAHLTEFRVSLQQDRQEGVSDQLLNVGQRMTVGQIRVY
ncbi:MAG: hypothetical protein AAF560_03400 [Acidobacteriota bacterium]